MAAAHNNILRLGSSTQTANYELHSIQVFSNLSFPKHIEVTTGVTSLKISDTINEYKKTGRIFYSFEYFPPKTRHGVQNLLDRIDRMATLNPAFVDVTWGAGGSTSENSLKIAENVQKFFGLDVLLHLTCTNMPVDAINDTLEKAKSYGVENILALRGDPPTNASWEACDGGFNYARDLVSHIQKNYPGEFCVGVAGYPEKHSSKHTLEQEIEFLKEKVDAGADFIITQLFYDPEVFLDYRDKVAAAGIKVPVIPGVMPINNYSRFLKFCSLASIFIPEKIKNDLSEIKQNDVMVAEYGVKQCVEMCQRLIEGGVDGIHFYTLNLESSAKKILARLALSNSGGVTRQMPWRQSKDTARNESEDVRPIFWKKRPVSYLKRTESWDDFPNGRWGDNSSPTFGELNSYHLFRRSEPTEKFKAERIEMWGAPTTLEDISSTFVKFCRGKISSLPWCELPMDQESEELVDELTVLNEKMLFTINSQPALNGVDSENPIHGWGDAGGKIYQKAYLEFFTSEEKLSKLMSLIKDFPTLSLRAFNAEGKYTSTCLAKGATAVTWGVFPEREIIQPTIVDTKSFGIWKTEAFDLWSAAWANLFESEHPSRQFLEKIKSNYHLVNIVDHNFVDGNIFSIFESID